MAKRKGYEEKKLDINEEVRRLRERGPERLYLLWGKEDYLREYFLQQLKQVCLPEGEDSFSYRRLNGPALDVQTLREAVELVVFQDLPYAEAGEVLGVPLGTVKSRIFNALKKLKEHLGHERRS